MRVGQQPVQLPGLYLAGFLCLALAVLKLTTEGHWSWRRVLIPLWAILGHNALYMLVGFIWLFFVDHGDAEESLTIRQNPPHSYQHAGMLRFLLFADNLLGRMGGRSAHMVLAKIGPMATALDIRHSQCGVSASVLV
jgi:hypothetical protein